MDEDTKETPITRRSTRLEAFNLKRYLDAFDREQEALDAHREEGEER